VKTQHGEKSRLLANAFTAAEEVDPHAGPEPNARRFGVAKLLAVGEVLAGLGVVGGFPLGPLAGAAVEHIRLPDDDVAAGVGHLVLAQALQHSAIGVKTQPSSEKSRLQAVVFTGTPNSGMPSARRASTCGLTA
jgi:hypothetical protein